MKSRVKWRILQQFSLCGVGLWPDPHNENCCLLLLLPVWRTSGGRANLDAHEAIDRDICNLFETRFYDLFGDSSSGASGAGVMYSEYSLLMQSGHIPWVNCAWECLEI